LLAYAHFANKRGEVWAGMEELVGYTLLNEKTIRKATRLLLANGLMLDTGKCRGATGKIPLYQLPLNSATNPPKNGGIAATTNPATNPPPILQQSSHQSSSYPPKIGSIDIGGAATNPEPGTRNPENDDKKTLDNSLAGGVVKGPLAAPLKSLLSSLSHSEEERTSWREEAIKDARKLFPNAPDIERHVDGVAESIRAKGDKPTAKWVLNALRRNPPRIPDQCEGYVYKGKFIPAKEANELAKNNTEIQLGAKPAIRHADGRIVEIGTQTKIPK
jgi:hypothetical protein